MNLLSTLPIFSQTNLTHCFQGLEGSKLKNSLKTFSISASQEPSMWSLHSILTLKNSVASSRMQMAKPASPSFLYILHPFTCHATSANSSKSSRTTPKLSTSITLATRRRRLNCSIPRNSPRSSPMWSLWTPKSARV